MTGGALLKRALAERRRVLVPIALLAAINVGVYAGLVYPLSVRVASSEARANAAKARLAAARRDAEEVNGTLTRTETAARDLQRFYKEILPQDISGARRLTYARLDEIAREYGLSTERRAYDIDRSHRGRLERLVISMVLTGEYEDIRGFIHALETSEEFVVIEDVGLAEGSDPSGPLALTLRLATYYPGSDDGS